MRFFLLLLTVLMVTGLSAGVLTGRALFAGNTQQPSEGSALPDTQRLGYPGETLPPAVGQRASPIDRLRSDREAPFSDEFPLRGRQAPFPGETLPPSRGTSSFVEAPRQVREALSSSEPLPNVLGRSLPAALRTLRDSDHSPRLSAASTGGVSTQFVQVSREPPSALTILLVPAGDVNLDMVIDMTDLLLVTRALGATVPLNTAQCVADFSVEECLVDLNGDGLVDVLDMAIVAANLWEQLP